MPRVHSQIARKDYPEQGIVKGQKYYKWTTRPGGRGRGILHRSPTYPKPQQLTSSDFLRRVYDINDLLAELQSFLPRDDIEAARDEAVNMAEELRDEQQEKLDNMPESLQYSPTGELLQERHDALEAFIDELQGVEIPDEVEEPDDEPDLPDEPLPPAPANYDSDEDFLQAEEKHREELREWESAAREHDDWQERQDAYDDFISELEDAISNMQGAEISV